MVKQTDFQRRVHLDQRPLEEQIGEWFAEEAAVPLKYRPPEEEVIKEIPWSKPPKKVIDQYLPALMPSERNYLERIEARKVIWMPQSNKQWLAFLSRADEVFYGGAAGGGKTDLLIGMAVECHRHSVIFRRVYPNLKEVMRRTREVIGPSANENKAEKLWVFPDGKTIEFGAVQYEDNKSDWQGRPHDLKAFDELPEFTRSQYEFICGWNRTTDPKQRVRVIATGNPPMDESGSWILRYWGPWLEDKHPNPAKPGELRWYATIDGEEQEFTTGKPIVHEGETIYPRSRTFIPATLADNPYYAQDNRYRSVLQALPEPLRSQLLHGDFHASAIQDPWQVIPTEWVRLAQQRWLDPKRKKPKVKLTTAGLDPARGGRDKMALARRYDNWFDEIITWLGLEVPDGPAAAAKVKEALGREDPGALNVDVIGVGSSAYDSLKTMYTTVIPVNAAAASEYRDRSGKLKMRNVRAEMYWRMRDALDPEYGDDLALPPGNEIVADLCSARYENTVSGVKIEEKEQIKARLGRSPDTGESLLLANFIANPGPQIF